MASTTEEARDAFTFIDRTIDLGTTEEPPQLFPKFGDLSSGKVANPLLQLLKELRAKYPEYVVTNVDVNSLNLLAFASAGYAIATLDIETDSIFRVQAWQRPFRRDLPGHLAEGRGFAKYKYRWGDEEFILYCVTVGIWSTQYVLKELGPGEGQLSHSTITDTLLAQIGIWTQRDRKGIYVYDLMWRIDEELYNQVQKASWDKVILDPRMKKELKSVSGRFFDSEAVYEDLGVPWKRGLIFYGPAGNGKTISMKALMHTLADRKEPVPTLYVKAAPRTFDIRNIFVLARQMSPCLLILEDIDTIVTSQSRSYFFNEVDGLENNSGIMMIASTNHIDRLDPGLSKRPSRFDRKYLFPAPSKAERLQYAQYWRKKLQAKPEVDFPEVLLEPIASITYDFSFAYIQEAFVASLLAMAHDRNDDDEGEGLGDGARGGGEDLDKYELWRNMNAQVKILREEMDSEELAKGLDLITPATKLAEQSSYDSMEHSAIPIERSRDINIRDNLKPQNSCYSTTNDLLAMHDPTDELSTLQQTFPSSDLLGQGMTWFKRNRD